MKYVDYMEQEDSISDEGPPSVGSYTFPQIGKGIETLLGQLRSHADRSKRVTLEFPVLDVALDSDEVLQGAVEFGWLSDAHMTVLHLGRIPAFVDDLCRVGATVDAEIVASQLAEAWAPLLRAAAVQGAFQLAATELTDVNFGDSSTPVLGIAVTPAVQHIRDRARDALLSVIARNGISDPEDFMAKSPAIQQPSSIWYPHVSLPPSLARGLPRRHIAAGTLQLSFGELRLR